jgi:uncharacterized protein
MINDNDYIINIAGIKTGKHTFDLSADASVFESFNPEMLEGARLQVTLELNKSESMIEANIGIEGEVDLICDRSLRPFSEFLDIQERVFYKFGDEAKELSEDVMIIPFHQQSIDFQQLVYELVSVAIPMKKLHPDYRDEEDEDWVYVVGNDDNDENSTDEDTIADPRWEVLKQLKSKK